MGEAAAADAPDLRERVLQVSDLHGLMNGALRQAGLHQVTISGVVSGLRVGPRFTNFELVEHDGTSPTPDAVLAVGVFAKEFRAMTQTLAVVGVELADGLEVCVSGRLEVNARYSRVRLLAQDVDARVSVATVTQARERLMSDLADGGRLEAQQRLQVATRLRRVGLISAAAAAGRADVLAVLESSPYEVEVVEAQVPVSGPDAGDQIAGALAYLGARGVEVIIVARGGGARSDLAVWDSPTVAEAVVACPVAVWSALGHATDHTVTDAVAHRSFPTPSAAAAAVVERCEEAVRVERQLVTAREQEAELAHARRRVRTAVLVAVLALALVAVILGLRL
jgi:exodeoxyribonuclease VII large subunit